MSTETFEKTFDVPSPASLSLANIRGSVQIQSGDEGAIHISATRWDSIGDAGHTEIVMEQRVDGRVVVETRFPEKAGWLFLFPQPCKVDYVVRVPPACNLRLSLVSSRASVCGLEGEIGIKTVSGPLTLEALYGNMKVKTVSGDLRGRHLSGALDLETVSASARLEASQFPNLYAKTVSGDLFVETGLDTGPYRFNTVSGGVYLSVPPETSCTITSSSLSGRISSQLATTRSENRPGWRWLEVQGGGTEIEHHSISGSLRLLASLAAAEPDLGPQQEEEQAEEASDQLDVLKRIARGELTAEEGLKLL